MNGFFIIMAVCRGCKASESADDPLSACDWCSFSFCRTCANLSSTELRAVALRKRTIIFLCPDCRSGMDQLRSGPGNPSALKDSMLDCMKAELANVSDVIKNTLLCEIDSRISSVKDEISAVRQTNIDLVRLLTDDRSLSLVRRPSLNVEAKCDDSLDATPVETEASVVPISIMKPPERKISSMDAPRRNSGNKLPASQDFHSGSGSLTRKRPVGLGKALPGASGESIRNKPIIGSRRLDKSAITAATIQKKTSILVGRLDKSVTMDNLREYLLSTFGSGENFAIEEQMVKSGDYRSYRVETRLELLGQLLCPSSWPENVLVKKFRFFRSREAVKSPARRNY